MSQNQKVKRFDCIDFKDRAQAEIYEATKGMTRDEFRAYVRRRVEEGPLADAWRRQTESTRRRRAGR